MERELKSPASKERKAKERKAARSAGLSVPRYFTTPGVDPADEMAWEFRTAGITGEDGKSVFERQMDGWYVLAGSPRSYSLEIPAGDCSKLKKMVIEAQTDAATIGNGGMITTEVEIPQGACK